MDERDAVTLEPELDGMAGAQARALAIRNTVMQHSDKFLLDLVVTIPCDSHTIYFIDDEDDEVAGDDIDGDEWSD